MKWQVDVSVWTDKPSVIQAYSDTGEGCDYLPERTCMVEKTETDEFGHWVYVSCGHVILTHGKPSYCSTCGARVVPC